VSVIEPIDIRQREHIVAATDDCIRRANELLDTKFASIAVSFDLIGRTAGMYRIQGGQRSIRYNPYLFAKYYGDNFATTIPHEVAHYLTDAIYGYRTVRPHGREWRTIMRMLGADESVRCNFNLDGIPTRRYQRIRYICRCQTHELTKVRHNRIQSKGARYFCRRCSTQLLLAAEN
jgi:SprT protein